jgi:hypothetical protein
MGRPQIKLDYIIKNEKLGGNDCNSYIRSFCGDERFIERLYEEVEKNAAILKLMNKSDLKKEITECYSAICLAERSLRRQGSLQDLHLEVEDKNPHCLPCNTLNQISKLTNVNDTLDESVWDKSLKECLLTFTAIRHNAKQLVFYDVCSGKGILSFLLAILFPEVSKIIMIDSNAEMNLAHLDADCCSSITYSNYDIHSEDFAQFMAKESVACCSLNFIPIVIGVHLCGALSTRLTQLYNTNNLSILIVSPCCAPTRSKKISVFMTREKLRKNKWSSYEFWYMSVYVSISASLSVRDVVKDDLVLSEKNTLIVAIKKTFLQRTSATSLCEGNDGGVGALSLGVNDASVGPDSD